MTEEQIDVSEHIKQISLVANKLLDLTEESAKLVTEMDALKIKCIKLKAENEWLRSQLEKQGYGSGGDENGGQ